MATTLPTDPEFTAALAALTEAPGATAQDVIRVAVLERYQRMCLMQAATDSPAERAEHMQKVLDRLSSV
ncbi:CopG family transcripitonal regulator [Knoellia sinensis KCTC 19936]|uniref:CopG family transcripitonal regulator n=1 Tax=Knoellia sinensis KCTC 19936 TaxID=1385520 RepID=A0A0A0J2U2_9MICO|nr:hypothetical protein [Knoellia sinensis]KGN31715.1 CopG family transcripitonal regulator [Knoellia sinensis KCTC 19936]